MLTMLIGAPPARPRGARLASVPDGEPPEAEFGFPGPLPDRLVAAVLDGSKTTTSGLVADYEHEHEPAITSSVAPGGE